MTLKQSVAYAIDHNRMLAVSATSVQQVEAQVDMATGRLLPRVDVSTGFMRTDSPLSSFGAKLLQQRVTAADFNPAVLNHPGQTNNYQTRLGLTMPLFSGGALWSARAGAADQADAANFNHAYAKQQVIYRTIADYVQARQMQALVNARANAVKAATRRWQDAQALIRKGMALKSDVMDANVHRLQSEVALRDAENGYAAALESLRLTLGMEGGTGFISLEEPRLDYALPPLDVLLEKHAEQRPDLLALLSQKEAAEMNDIGAKSGFLPRVDLMAAQEWNSDTFGLKNRNSMIGVNVSLNLFSGGADVARVREATSQSVALDYRVADKRQQIGNEIRQAWRSMQMAEQRYRSEEEALKQTSESLRIKSLRHAQGLEKTSDLLDAQARADASEMAFIQARYDLIRARAALFLAAGILDEGVIR